MAIAAPTRPHFSYAEVVRKTAKAIAPAEPTVAATPEPEKVLTFAERINILKDRPLINSEAAPAKETAPATEETLIQTWQEVIQSKLEHSRQLQEDISNGNQPAPTEKPIGNLERLLLEQLIDASSAAEYFEPTCAGNIKANSFRGYAARPDGTWLANLIKQTPELQEQVGNYRY